MRHGFGTNYYSSGAKYEGNFHTDKRHGKGKMVSKDGTVFEYKYKMGI